MPRATADAKRQALIEAAQLWYRLNSEPPSSTCWSLANARKHPRRYPEILVQRHGLDWPSANAALKWFGSWRAFIVAAGFTPNRVGSYAPGRRKGDDPEIREAALAALSNGGTVADVAADLGASEESLRNWAKAAGVIPTQTRIRALPGVKRIPVDAEVRWAVWERDDFRCKHCGVRRHLTLDHVHPVALGGTNDSENLQTLCRVCNSRKNVYPADTQRAIA